jgi:hypothetical protein
MSADFGADLDAALSGHLQAIRAAADAAKAHVDESISGLTAEPEPDPVFAAPPGLDFPPPAHAAAVDFSLEEPNLEFDPRLDQDGIPMPEEI